MHENCDRLQFRDVTLALMSDAIYVPLLKFIIKQLQISIGEISQCFGKLANVVTFFVKFHAGTEKSLSDFWPSLFKQAIKFVLSSEIMTSCMGFILGLCTAEIRLK